MKRFLGLFKWRGLMKEELLQSTLKDNDFPEVGLAELLIAMSGGIVDSSVTAAFLKILGMMSLVLQ